MKQFVLLIIISILFAAFTVQKNISVNTGAISDNSQSAAVLTKEIELLKLQIEEIKVSTSNPLSN